MTVGKVYLIGAGPGDPGLLTLKGKRFISEADVVIYDYLAARVLLDHAPSDAEMIYVGKKGGDHTLSQDGINRLIIEKAKAGNVVARLKGGDPFIFGRGGEEAEILVENQIPFEVVPGITSAIAAPAYAGIPLTHRDHTATLAFVTGHEDPTKEESNIDWAALAKGIGTLVFLMGVKNLPHIVGRLLDHGRSPQTPVALVRWGTTAQQVTVRGMLSDIVRRVEAARLKAPAVIVVGEVVGLRDRLRWFDTRPLTGKRIVVTRAREQASDLVTRLQDLGADCLEIPTIQVAPPRDPEPLNRAIDEIDQYNWLVFTSVNGVKYFFNRLFSQGRDVRALGHLQTAAIGPATADRLLGFGITCDILPDSYRAESVVDAFADVLISGKRILLPRAREARSVLPDSLTRMGARVDEITAYRTELDSRNRDVLLDALENGQVDMVTFTSSSTVKNFKALLPEDRFRTLPASVRIVAIGPITADTAADLGFTVHRVAETYTIPGLCDAILADLGGSGVAS
ncbi:MAG: uroporphyrinogen-III C-methyltransferase [Deltaproteobacteria bacterium]|nr:uroporphyrinogen-III C-methyltransferase [Deltaproteobacteria bacterium]